LETLKPAVVLTHSTSVGPVFLYDGWSGWSLNLEETKNQAPGTTNVIKRHTWGFDLGSLQGAGGVGGLLLTETVTPGNLPVPMYATYDGNGNLTALADASGAAVAGYEYDPYGNLLSATGPSASGNPFRFSTKYADEERGLVYYGYRYYDAVAGRWVSRDPIEEAGGSNLYSIVYNAPTASYDIYGLSCSGTCSPKGSRSTQKGPLLPCLKPSGGLGFEDCTMYCTCCYVWITYKIKCSGICK